MSGYEQRKTGTTIVGIVAKDGVVIASDRRVTAGGRFVVKKDFVKQEKILDHLLVAVAGSVSDVQLNIKLLKAQLKLLHVRRGRPATTEEAVNLLANMQYGSLRRSFMIPAIAVFIIGGYDEKGPQLFETGPDGSLNEHKDYTTEGSGMMYATGVLEAGYKNGISIPEAIKLGIAAVKAAIERDTASGNGINVSTITKNGVETVYEAVVRMTTE